MFEDWSEDNTNLVGIIVDSTSDLKDDGFDVSVYNELDQNSYLFVTITKPGMEYKRQTNLGFLIDEIKPSVNELLSQLDTQRVHSIYFHIKGYEPMTWYDANFDKNSILKSLSDVTFGMDVSDKIDKLTIEFEPRST